MTVRALIIAIESYAQVRDGSLAKSLPGTLQAGLDVRDWLIATKPAPQILFCSEPQQPQIGGTGASLQDLIDALLLLQKDGTDATKELYVFFSGHGFTYAGDEDRADIIVTSDFRSVAASSPCCVKLDGVVRWLRETLGAGRHVYFVDACRNILRPDQAAVGNSQIVPRSPGSSGMASACMLQSTSPGAVAAANGAFPKALLAGLGGAGRAKSWDDRHDGAMVVTFDSLTRQVQTQVRVQTVAPWLSGILGSDCILNLLSPVPETAFTVEIQGDIPSPLAGTLRYRRARSAANETRAVAANPSVLRFEPDTYKVSLLVENATVVEDKPVQVDLYDDAKLVFTVAAQPTADLKIPGLDTVIAGSTNTLGNAIGLDAVTHGFGLDRIRETLREMMAPPASRPPPPDDEAFAFPPAAVDEGPPWQGSLPATSIADQFPKRPDGGLDFSESLGAVTFDPDLEVWLGVIGGGRILGVELAFLKLAKLPLQPLSEQATGASPLYVLAALDQPEPAFRVGLSHEGGATWQSAVAVKGMPGIYEALVPVDPGPHLLSLHVPGEVPLTVATFAMPDRATLVTLAPGGHGSPKVQQYLLPLGHRRASLPSEARDSHSFMELPLVEAAARARRAFRDGRPLSDELTTEQASFFATSPWLDPLSTCLVAYDEVRQGRQTGSGDVVATLRRVCPDLPDAAALAAAHHDGAAPLAVPLVLDGVLAYSDLGTLPLPSARLDLKNLWTVWRAAVGPA